MYFIIYWPMNAKPVPDLSLSWPSGVGNCGLDNLSCWRDSQQKPSQYVDPGVQNVLVLRQLLLWHWPDDGLKEYQLPLTRPPKAWRSSLKEIQ